MDRRTRQHRIDALSRNELQRFAADVVDLAGPDAVARLVADAPFSPRAPSGQLALAAVDADGLRAELERLSAIALVRLRAAANADDALSRAVLVTPIADALDAAWTAVGDRIRRALAFDPVEGLDVLETAARTVERLARAETAWGVPDAGAPAHADAIVVDAFADAVGRHAAAGLDAETLARLLDIAARLRSTAGAPTVADRLGEALAAEPHATTLSTIERWLDHHPRITPGTLPLLRALHAAAHVDALVRAVEAVAPDSAAAIALLVDALITAERYDEARFWLGEGRILHPDFAGWDALDGRLY